MTAHMAPLDDPTRLRHLVAHLRVGVYVANARGDILDANSAFLRMLGVRSLDELRTYGSNEMVVDLDRRHAQLDAIDREGAVVNWEFQLVRPDGTFLTVLDTCHVMRPTDGGDPIYCGALVDITDRKHLEDQLRQQSLRDPLTGCFNRRHLTEVSEMLAAEQAAWGCLYVDVDHFKQYNDRHGHQMGDNTLIRMSRFLMRQVRAEEPVFRVGGDEFVVLLRGASREQTALVADRLRTAALRTAPVPFSLGWAHREGAESVAQTINRADQNLLAVRVIDRGVDRLGGEGSSPA